MRLLSFDQLKPLKGIPYCRVHLTRLEDAGRFPRRRQLGDNRVGWLESEIDDWLANLVEGKLPPVGAPAATCKVCRRRFERQHSRGRPPDRCPECRNKQSSSNSN